MQYLNLLVISLSWLSLGKPNVAPQRIRTTVLLSEEQLLHVENLAYAAAAWKTSAPVGVSSLGRTAGRIPTSGHPTED